MTGSPRIEGITPASQKQVDRILNKNSTNTNVPISNVSPITVDSEESTEISLHRHIPPEEDPLLSKKRKPPLRPTEAESLLRALLSHLSADNNDILQAHETIIPAAVMQLLL